MRILVTGTDGYLGCLLAPQLIADGHEVVAVDTGFYRNGWLYGGLDSIPYTLSDVADVFEGRFPGYVAPTDWPTAYDSWSTSALDTLRGALASAGRNVADAPSVQAALDALRSSNDSAQGRLEALQIGNQIASLQVEEMTKLRQLFAAQINGQNAYLGAQEAKAAGSAAAFDTWVGNAPRAIPVSRASEGLGTVPRP